MILCLGVCMFVSAINVQTAGLIGPKFCVGPHMTPGKIYRRLKFPKICFQQNSIFIKFWNSHIFLCKIHELFFTTRCKAIHPILKPFSNRCCLESKTTLPQPKPNPTYPVNRRQIREKWKHILNIEMLKIRDHCCKL